MDFEALTKDLDAAQSAKTDKKKPTGQIAINDQKLYDLEKEIEANFAAADKTKKGCFGKLVRLADSEICKTCKDGVECEAALLAEGQDQIAEAEAVINAIVTDNELDAEFKNIAAAKPKAAEIEANPVLKTIYDVANEALGKPADEPEKVEPTAEEPVKVEPPKNVPQGAASIDLSYLGKKVKVAFDFNLAKDLILVEKPESFKRVRAICLGLVSDPIKHRAASYHNSNKVMKALQDLNIIGWDTAANKITYNI